MTQYEMTEKLSQKTNVTMEEARNALEAGDWNVLTATHLLDREKFRRMQELNEVAASCDAAAVQAAPEEAVATEEIAAEAQPAADETAEPAGRARARKHRRGQGLRNLGGHICRLVACGNRNRLEVRKGGELVLELPVTVLALGVLCAFWLCVPLLVIGLFAGCRYGFNGQDLGRENINGALTKAADAVDNLKNGVAHA